MFKLVPLTIGYFVVAKSEDGLQNQTYPINVHGFIQVVNIDYGKETAILVANEMSNELANSNELDGLLNEATELTKEFVADK